MWSHDLHVHVALRTRTNVPRAERGHVTLHFCVSLVLYMPHPRSVYKAERCLPVVRRNCLLPVKLVMLKEYAELLLMEWIQRRQSKKDT